MAERGNAKNILHENNKGIVIKVKTFRTLEINKNLKQIEVYIYFFFEKIF